MFHVFSHLNVVALLAATVVGFLFGWIWYSPLLFSRAWRQEMRLTESDMKAAGPRMGRLIGSGFLFTLISTLGLMTVLHAAAASSWLDGALLGAFIGAVLVGARVLNSAVWEGRSARLLRINLGHETLLFALQGAILGQWA
jgi:hypothetical protein